MSFPIRQQSVSIDLCESSLAALTALGSMPDLQYTLSTKSGPNAVISIKEESG